VKITLSADGGHTYPYVLAESTPNDGSQSVTVPKVATSKARIRVEAVGNVFFDISDADFTTVVLPGIVGLNSVGFGGNALTVDSFDSSVGAYGSGNRGSAATLFSNGPIGLGHADLGGDVVSALSSVNLDKATVSGNVTAGTSITGSGSVGGTSTANSPSAPLTAPAVAGCSPYSSASGIGGKFTYSPVTGDLTVGGGKTATLVPGTYCFHNVVVSGGSVLTVAGPVTIRLKGILDASGGSLVNGTRIPTSLQFESSYSGADGVALSGGTGAYVTVYAPSTSITLTGKSPFHGALLGKTLAASGGAAIHYDVRTLGVWASYFEN